VGILTKLPYGLAADVIPRRCGAPICRLTLPRPEVAHGSFRQSRAARRATPCRADAPPRTLDEIVGQASITAAGSALRRRIKAKALGSIILYGPPGVGKTSIAQAVGAMLGNEFHQLHAARAVVADLRKLADEARMKPRLCRKFFRSSGLS